MNRPDVSNTLCCKTALSGRINLLCPLAFGSIATFLVYYLVLSSQYYIPLGDDGTIYIWPVGQLMAAGTFKDILHLSIASFLGEDHLAPLQHFLGFLCQYLPWQPEKILNATAKATYLIIIATSLIVVFDLWKDSIRLSLFFLFITFNIAMFWRNLVVSILNIPVILPLWCLFFVNRFIHYGRTRDLILFAFMFFLLTMSFETAFIGIPLIAVYTAVAIWTKSFNTAAKIKEASVIFLIMLLLFIPYLIIHYSLYGNMLPPSRTSAVLSEQTYLSNYLTMFARLLTNWYYGVDFKGLYLSYGMYVRLVFIILIALAIYGIIRYRLLSKTGRALFYACFSQIILILYTGRIEAGMWILAGIVSWMVAVDLLYHTARKILKEERRVSTAIYVSIVLLIPFLFAYNTRAQPLLPAELYYHRHYESSQAAYKAIDENTDRIVLLRLPGAEPLMHPMAFWMGNKIYHGEPGLGFYPEYSVITFRNMNIESHENPEERSFEHFRPLLVPRPGRADIVVVKDRNSFSRMFLDSSDAKISRTAVIPYAPQDSLLLRYPTLSMYSRGASHIEIRLTFSKRPVDIEKIRYGKSEIARWESSDRAISFISDDLSSENPLTITWKTVPLQVELIEVRFRERSPISPGKAGQSPNNKISVIAENPCRYSISLSIGGSAIAGTLDAGKSLSFSPVFAEPGAITYSSFDLMREKRKSQTLPLDAVSGQIRPIVIGRFGN